jgi:hypothetical protein
MIPARPCCPVCATPTPANRISDQPWCCSIACYRAFWGIEQPAPPSCHDPVTTPARCAVDPSTRSAARLTAPGRAGPPHTGDGATTLRSPPSSPQPDTAGRSPCTSATAAGSGPSANNAATTATPGCDASASAARALPATSRSRSRNCSTSAPDHDEIVDEPRAGGDHRPRPAHGLPMWSLACGNRVAP